MIEQGRPLALEYVFAFPPGGGVIICSSPPSRPTTRGAFARIAVLRTLGASRRYLYAAGVSSDSSV